MPLLSRAAFALFALCVAVTLAVIPDMQGAQADASAEQPILISASWPAGVQNFVREEQSHTVFNVLYHWGRIAPGATGAIAPNTTAPRTAWYIEYQRAGNVDVTAGVLHRDPALVADGLKIFHFGLAREAANGSFPGSFWPFHGTAMFLAESSPSLIMLKYSPMEGQFDSELRWQIARMRTAAYYMVRHVGGPGHIDDHTKNHRYYEASMALGAVGVLSGDQRLVTWSKVYIKKAMSMERPDGVMPEDGGHDTGYQALGMMHAARYLELIATGTLYSRLYKVLQRGERWEISRVRADGTINQQGDTRTAGCEERSPLGTCKTTFYATISNALARWSAISSDNTFARAAYAVWLQNWKLVPGDVLPVPGLFAKPTQLRNGQWLTVWGTRFQPLETVKVYFGTTLEATITCDQTGNFGGHSPVGPAHFALPPVPTGTYTIEARGSYGTVRRTTVSVIG